jgi:hypothetical protein
VESEGSWRQNPGLMKRNHIQGRTDRTSLPNKAKSNATRILGCKCGSCIRRRLLALTRGGLAITLKAAVYRDPGWKGTRVAITQLNCKKSAEAEQWRTAAQIMDGLLPESCCRRRRDMCQNASKTRKNPEKRATTMKQFDKLYPAVRSK